VVLADRQKWATLERLAQAGAARANYRLEPDLFGITVEPKVGIGQHTHVVRTRTGNLLWDPVGYLDDQGVNRVRLRGEVIAIAASHPHMFGVLVEGSKRAAVFRCSSRKLMLTGSSDPDPAIRTDVRVTS
jgi:hypothetical protein